MRFSEPWWLTGLLAVACLVLAYLLLLRQRRRDIMLFTNLALLDRLAPARPRRYRHLPLAVSLVALSLLVVAMSGPEAEAKVPRNRATVMLVIDVSLSMQSTDVAPSRLAAAQAAATSFADQLTPGVNLGLESFAGTAVVLVSPTVDRTPVKQAIADLKLAESTATGEAIFAALQSITTFTKAVAASSDGPPPAQIVLMSDGGQTVPAGPDAENQPRGGFTAARAAAAAGIPISTISFGTEYGTVQLDPTQQPVAVPVDNDALHRIADLSGGQFFTASTEAELRQVYAHLGEQIGYETRLVDQSRPWLDGGTLLMMVGLGWGIGLGRRIP